VSRVRLRIGTRASAARPLTGFVAGPVEIGETGN